MKNQTNCQRNYQRELDSLLEQMRQKGEKQKPGLFLHSCCAPCSSYVLEYLRVFFRITVFYYNPNIDQEEEYRKRVEEQKRLIASFNQELPEHVIEICEGAYEPERFVDIARGLEECPEGGVRCHACFALRLGETARLAAEGGYDYFGTTLTISPLKNAAKLNEIGEKLAGMYDVSWLPSDFKKKNGYKRSLELSILHELYRQDYCGCVYSKWERKQQKALTEKGKSYCTVREKNV